MITSIAEQTNLLALNATIEAARAGDAGKGFAVVANEVKDLAQQTANATATITAQVEGIQTDTNDAVQAIAELANVIGQINETQASIAAAVEEQTVTTNEIGGNVSEAATGTNEIARAVTEVASTTRANSDGAEQTHGAAGELARLASDLETLVGRFQY
jgi:methyl-accepting chemotaxis protein